MIFGSEWEENSQKNIFPAKLHQNTPVTWVDKPPYNEKTPNLIFAPSSKSAKNDGNRKKQLALTAGGKICHLFKSGFSKTKKSIFQKIP